MTKRSDLDYLAEAYVYAAEHSPDISTKNAAFLVDKKGIVVARAANTFPYGVEITHERLHTRPDKYDYTGHAEENVVKAYIRMCEDEGRPTNFKELTMYVPWFPCAPCARDIIDVRIPRVIGHQSPFDWDNEDAARAGRHDFSGSFSNAYIMLNEAGVEHRNIVGKIGGGIENLHSGQIRFP